MNRRRLVTTASTRGVRKTEESVIQGADGVTESPRLVRFGARHAATLLNARGSNATDFTWPRAGRPPMTRLLLVWSNLPRSATADGGASSSCADRTLTRSPGGAHGVAINLPPRRTPPREVSHPGKPLWNARTTENIVEKILALHLVEC